jgi:hypothetical protein
MVSNDRMTDELERIWNKVIMMWSRYWNGLRQHAWTTCFLEYPAGQYPVSLANCPPANVSKQHHWMYERQNIWAYETVPNNTSPNTEYCCTCLDWIVLCGFTSLQILLIIEIQYAIPSETCSVSEEHMAAKKGSSSAHCWRNYWQISWHGIWPRGLRACTHCKWYRCNCSWRTGHTVVHPMCGSFC